MAKTQTKDNTVKITLAHNLLPGNAFLPEGAKAGAEVTVAPDTARHLAGAGYVVLPDRPGAINELLTEQGVETPLAPGAVVRSFDSDGEPKAAVAQTEAAVEGAKAAQADTAEAASSRRRAPAGE